MSAQNKTEKNDGVTVKKLQMDSTSVSGALKVDLKKKKTTSRLVVLLVLIQFYFRNSNRHKIF